MSLTVSQIYSVRFATKLALPKSVQDNIARLRITPVTYKPFRPPPRHARQRHDNDNWRMKSLSTYVSKIKDKADPEYCEVMGILNKLSKSNMNELSNEAIKIINNRDQDFRLRVSALLFNKSITESMFCGIMADCAVKLVDAVPDVKDDILVQLTMFPKLYDINDTLTFPVSTEEGFDEKVIVWMKQKDKRRGYAKFVTQLYVRELVTEEFMAKTFTNVIDELKDTAKQARTEQTEENVTQFVDFLFESSKVLPATAKALREIVRIGLVSVLDIPRPELPSLCMRSRFRIEDTIKCVQAQS